MKQDLPALKPKQVVAALEKAGFLLKRQTGSHAILFKPGFSRPITVPIHVKDMPKGTLRAIIRQADLNVSEFLRLL
jgi:predicted RNA binding protein YcfA (HicA-like mRNA interferase family)